MHVRAPAHVCTHTCTCTRAGQENAAVSASVFPGAGRTLSGRLVCPRLTVGLRTGRQGHCHLVGLVYKNPADFQKQAVWVFISEVQGLQVGVRDGGSALCPPAEKLGWHPQIVRPRTRG